MEYWLLVTLMSFVTFVIVFYLYLQKKWSYWSTRKVNGPKPSLLELGNTLDRLLKDPSVFELEQLEKYGKVVGRYRGVNPVLTITDNELIKQVMIQDFHFFINKKALNTYDELWNGALFNAESTSWKRIRSITSPTFTSGKLRGMHHLMRKCISKLVNYFDEVANSGNGVFSPKMAISRLTIDVIASTAFATETNANDGGKVNPIVYNGLKLFQMNTWKVFCFLVFPRWLNDLLGIRFQFTDKYFDFFADLTREIVKQRKSSATQQKRHTDFVQLLIDAFVFEDELKDINFSKLVAHNDADETNIENPDSPLKQSKKSYLTENEIIAQCIIFFIAGFETTANTTIYALFEMSQNQDIQERLVNELEKALAKLDPDSDEYYDTVMNKIPFLDATIKETLRKYPPVVRLDRRVGVDHYKLAGIPLDKDITIEVSTLAVHRSEEYYPEPMRFNPDRFMPENKHLLVPYTYIPFGIGPRNCVGLRFAYQEIKLCLAQILRRFVFEPTIDTPKTLKYHHATLLLHALPFDLKVKRR